MPNIIAGAIGLTGSARYTLREMAQDAVGLLDHLEVDRAHVVGASMGGMIAQTLAAKHSDRVLSLCSIMSSAGGRKPAVMPRMSVIGTLLAKPPTEREAYATHVAKIFTRIGSTGYDPDYKHLRERSLLMYDRSFYPTGGARQLMAIMASGDRTRELHEIHCPTLVIHGLADKLIPSGAGEAVARAIPGARFEPIEGMGHDLPRALWPRITGSIAHNAERAKPERRSDRGASLRPPGPEALATPMRFALVTCERPIERDDDLDFVAPGPSPQGGRRRDARVDRSFCRLVLIRPGDDQLDLGLLRATGRVPGVAEVDGTGPPNLINPLGMVEWNFDKRYLLELEAAGVPTIPTVWIEPGGEAEAAAEIAELGWEQVVIKPVIDLGARNLVRVPAELVEEMLGRYDVATMAQPYLPSVAAEGELSLVHLGGELSHSLRKLPARGDFRVQPQYGGTHEAEEFGKVVREICEGAIAVAPGDPVYARVDVVGTESGPAVIELELIEPALYLDTDPRSGERLADALLAALAARN